MQRNPGNLLCLVKVNLLVTSVCLLHETSDVFILYRGQARTHMRGSFLKRKISLEFVALHHNFYSFFINTVKFTYLHQHE
jgi:hypothetical protein